ncbi:MAG: hypothetical protein H7X93_08940, partial [Sphingomonadaceae bacterium]|nr:hypothetical protein [Sphingomonadaceae bacterium]
MKLRIAASVLALAVAMPLGAQQPDPAEPTEDQVEATEAPENEAVEATEDQVTPEGVPPPAPTPPEPAPQPQPTPSPRLLFGLPGKGASVRRETVPPA